MSSRIDPAPYQGAKAPVQTAAPNAALLIDFDNVTMGMRSDLSKELRTLLNSDIIRGKVTVQRAYADWRRYPQYIVPLSESSIDLIFAPAYGSSKKNATDIRMAIDGMELVFTRPEIGTYILLTGDSDFSSLVLKLKEYGKYVIGVGIQESSSDILVQNCDEYYSYTSLSGLRKTTESDQKPVDPWVLVEEALKRMADRNDVMRSDRLKQVMLEIDAGFDEAEFGFSKFSRFLTEASSRGLVKLRKLDNGQYEVSPSDGRGGGGRGRQEESSGRGGNGRGRRDRSGERRGRESRRGRERDGGGERAASGADEAPSRGEAEGDPLEAAYALMRQALERLLDDESDAVRDSDVKRRMLEIDRSFDEAELGFSKFSHFLRQAHDHEAITLRKRDSGNYEVALPGARERPSGREEERSRDRTSDRDRTPDRDRGRGPEGERKDRRESRTATGRDADAGARRGHVAGGGDEEDAPPILEGQALGPVGTVGAGAGQAGATSTGSDERDTGREDGDRGPRAGEVPAGSADRQEPAAPEGPAETEAASREGQASPAAGGSPEDESLLGALGRRLGLRLGSTRRRREDEDSPPPLLEGQAVGGGGASGGGSPARQPDPGTRSEEPAGESAVGSRTGAASGASGAAGAVDPSELGLPTDEEAQVRYLTNSYRGVGKKTAETLVESFGEDLFTVLQEDPGRVEDVLPAGRAEQVLEQWREDLERRKARAGREGGAPRGGGPRTRGSRSGGGGPAGS